MTVEFLMTGTLIAFVLSGASWVLKGEWDRHRCAHFIFETAHAKLHGDRMPIPFGRIQVAVSVNENSVQASGICGRARESVELPKLIDPRDMEEKQEVFPAKYMDL